MSKRRHPEPNSSPVVAAPPLPVQEPAGGWPPDEFTGRAGRYVRDPVTGARRPADAQPEQPTPAA